MGKRSVNVVVLTGNLTRDIETRALPSGLTVGTMSLAVNDSVKKGDAYEEITSFVDVKVAGKTAEVCAQYLGKGSRVTVEGKLRMESWEKDGQKRSKLVVMGNQVDFGGSSGSAGAGNQGSGKPGARVVEPTEDEAANLPF